MPYTLKPNKIFAKDPNGDGYLPQNVVTDQSTAEQVALINSTGASQLSAIQTKGEQTLASIPKDYTALSGEVTDLKSAFDYAHLADGKIVSRNGNYAESSKYNIAGFFQPTGTIYETEEYLCGYIPLPGAGNYVVYNPKASYGTKAGSVPVFDGDKKFVRTITLENYDDFTGSFALSAADFTEIKYVGLSYRPSRDMMPMLMLNEEYPSGLAYVEPDYIFRTTSYEKNIAEAKAEVENKIDELENELIAKIAPNKIVSLNGNYFDADTAEWHNGIYAANTGIVTYDYPYQYAYTPILGAGDYIRINATEFGSNATRVALVKEDLTYGEYVTGTRDGRVTSFSLTEKQCRKYRYIVMVRHDGDGLIPKLYYDSAMSYETDALPPHYGFVTDPLYKKVLVCDGDSICQAVADNPQKHNGWFGRLKAGYQMTGKNYAVGGGTIMDKTNTTVGGNPRHSVCLTIDTIHAEYPNLDYLILEGGTNDADLVGVLDDGTPKPAFGNWDIDDFSGNYDPLTFCGGVEYLFHRAVSYYPHAKIGFIIAMEMGTTTAQATRRKRYFDEIVKIAAKWHIPVLNLWENCHTDARLTAYYDSSLDSSGNVSAGKFYYDGQHPTSYGYNFMQPMIEAWMKTL